jgi:hypothetical protein
MNDSIDSARDVTKPSKFYFDSLKMPKEIIGGSAPIKAWDTYKSRWGIQKIQPDFDGAREAKNDGMSQVD